MSADHVDRDAQSVRGAFASVAVIAAIAVAPPLLLGGYGLDVLTEIMIFAIAAISLDFMLGYGGLVSFGHAAFFGLGAYGTVLLTVRFGIGPWGGFLGAVAISCVAAILIGVFCMRLSGPSFLMMTLAFAQLLYSGAVKWRGVTGGTDGIGGLARPAFLGIDASNARVMYLLTLAVLVATFFAMRMLIRSQFGQALIGARENELRMMALGYRTRSIKLAAFVIAGTTAGLGGSLYAFYNGFVSPDALSFGISGMLLLMVVLGGKGSLVGALIGATVFLLMKNYVSSYTEHWLFIVGGVFVASVMFFPDGIYGLLNRLRGRVGHGDA